MKKILFFLFTFISITINGQLDREHWFAPMVDRANTGNSVQRIYMSTGESSPFRVDVYSNNVIIGSVTISKGSPQRFELNRSNIITTVETDLFKPISAGIYLKGEKPFFASLRFSINNHGEILTSKGTAGIGTEFRAVMAPITALNPILNFMTSVMATEDNTKITISEFNPIVSFSDEIARTQINFTLNKGQSYIVDGKGDKYNNHIGFIGARIVADKPVSVTNGNFNGQYATTATNSSDILMDQGVPVDKLGHEFVLMKGNGTTISGMEKAIIVATEDNTEIYLNNDTVPVAVKNAGEYYETDNSAYILQDYEHYNMRIKTNKNVYVYQLLAGNSGGSMLATGGFNYIPPLSCYLPKHIDEIGLINENKVFISNNGSFSENIPTKLNIITERGATINVKRNGTSILLTNQNGPFDVRGNTNWVTYSVPGITGNVSISSNRAITAGISAGDGAVGYGGYFAGFSSVPLITKISGECIPGVTLSVTEGLIKYQWLLKNGNSYIPIVGANQNTFNPTQAGIYAVKIQQGSCPEIQTQDYKFFNCTSFTNYDYEICNTQVITPEFALSTQTVNIATIKINTPPTKGTVTVNANGQITYTANPGSSGTDYFTYSFCGTGVIPDCETVQATINIRKINYTNQVLKACSNTATATFNLSEAAVSAETGITKKYFSDSGLTTEIPPSQLGRYISAESVVYVTLKNSLGCEETATITLKIVAPPIVTPSLYTQIHCDEALDGILDGNYKVSVNAITPIIVQNPGNYTVSYYVDEAKAISGSNSISGNYIFNGGSSVWVRVDSPEICAPVIKEVKLNTGILSPLLRQSYSATLCDEKNEGTKNIILSDYLTQFSTTTGTSGTYFVSSDDAKNNRNPLPDSYALVGSRTLFARITSPNFCTSVATLQLSLKNAKTSTSLPAELYICAEKKTTLDAGADFDAYLWSTGETGRRVSVPVGEYFVDLLKDNCTYRQKISIKPAAVPKITGIDIQENSVTVITTGGTAPLLYSLDQGPYQSSPTFTGVKGGNHRVYIISADNCAPVTEDFNVIALYNVITPNGDHRNDTFNDSGLVNKTEPSLQIFDRYGTLIFTGDANNRFSWDGKISGKTASTGSYWYVMKWREPGIDRQTQYTGWVMVKNRD